MPLFFRRELPIQWLIAASIVGMTLVMAGLLLWQSWDQARASLVEALERSSQQLSATVEVKTRAMIEPSRAMLTVLSKEASIENFDSARSDHLLPMLAAVVGAQEVLGGAYIGSDSGDFLMVRAIERLSAGAVPASLNLADGTYLALILHGDRQQGPAGYWQVLDDEARELRRIVIDSHGLDPRERPWYRQALAKQGPQLSAPYTFFTNGEQGVTLSQRSRGGRAVLGIDMTSADLGKEIHAFATTQGSLLAITTPEGDVLAHNAGKEAALLPGTSLEDLGEQPLIALKDQGVLATPVRYYCGEQDWWGLALPFDMLGSRLAWLLVAMPERELMASLRESLWHRLLLSLGLVTLMVPLGILLGRRLGRPLRELGDQVRTISEFDLDAYRGVESRVREVAHLSAALDTLVHRVGEFRRINRMLGRERRLDVMLDGILDELLKVTGSHHGVIYLAGEDSPGHLSPVAEAGQGGADASLPSSLEVDRDSGPLLEVQQALEAQGYLVQSLRDRGDKRLGVLLLAHREGGQDDAQWRTFVAEVSSVAAVAIDMRRLLEGEARLLDAMIQLVARATDAKSPHTGGHCTRVPQLAEMLIDEVDRAQHGPFAAVQLSEDERATFHLAAWLHDCGKLTTPDHIMEKATKLETRYNRIHEIRTRFEVLWRDAELDYWRALAQGGDPATLDPVLKRRHQELQQAFACVAEANRGHEAMTEATCRRLQDIGEWRWWRYFDDRLGAVSGRAGQHGR